MTCEWKWNGHSWNTECGEEFYPQDHGIFPITFCVPGVCRFCGREIRNDKEGSDDEKETPKK